MKKLLASIAIISLLSACANQTPAQKTASTQALNSVIQAGVSYASGNDVGAVVNGIQGASYFVRALQSTPNAASPASVATAVTTGTAPASLAPVVANAVTTLVANGASPNDANEQVAEALDAAVIQITGPTQASLPVNWISQDGIPHVCHAYRVKIDPSAFKRLTFEDHAQWLRQLELNKITRLEYRDMLKDEKVIAANAALRP